MIKRVSLGVLILVALVVPAFARGTHQPRFENWDRNIQYMDGNRSVLFASRGTLALSDDDRSIVSMAPGSRLYIRQTDRFTTIELLAEAADDGGYQQTVWVNGVEQDGRPGEQALVETMIWLAAVEFGVGARARMARRYSEEGLDAAIEVIRRVRIDDVRAELLAVLGRDYRLDVDEAVTLVRATTMIRASGELSGLLRTLSEHLAGGDNVTTELMRAASSIAASGDTRDAVIAIAAERGLERASGIEMARTIAGIAASSDKRDALLALAPAVAGDQDLAEAYLFAAQTVAASSDLRDALIALCEGLLPRSSYERFFSVATSVAASSDLRDVLEHAAGLLELEEYGSDLYLDACVTVAAGSDRLTAIRALNRIVIPENMAERLFHVIDTIPASSDARDALLDTLNHQELTPESLVFCAYSAGRLASSYDQGESLRALLSYVVAHGGAYVAHEGLRAAIDDAVDSIAARSDRERCRRAFDEAYR
jgi:hypothetical protein